MVSILVGALLIAAACEETQPLSDAQHDIGIAGHNQLPLAKSIGNLPRPTFGPVIDDYTARGAITCQAGIRAGVADLQETLAGAYSGLTFSVTRACSNQNGANKSLHHQGRALDVSGVSTSNATAKAKAIEIITWLMETDEHGNKHARARRMGIYSIIYNNKIWSSTNSSDRNRGPNIDGWRQFATAAEIAAKSNVDWGHYRHIHIGFGLAGAARQTSWWNGQQSNLSQQSIIGVKRTATGTGKVEAHELNGRTNFERFAYHAPTFINSVGANWRFASGDVNGDNNTDLIGIKTKNTASGKTEVHVLRGRQNAGQTFSDVISQTVTPLGNTSNDWEFTTGDWNRDGRDDLLAIKAANTGSNKTEVHVLLASADPAQNFTTVAHVIPTALHAVNTTIWDFEAGDFNADGIADLYAIKRKNTPSGKAEVHVLTGTAQPGTAFKNYAVHAETPVRLGNTSSDWEFVLGHYDNDNRTDVYVVKKEGTGSNFTEVHVLRASAQFAHLAPNLVAGLHETGENWNFVAG